MTKKLNIIDRIPKTTLTNLIWVISAYSFTKGWIGNEELGLIGGVLTALGITVNKDKLFPTKESRGQKLP